MQPEQNFVVQTVEQKTKFFAPLFQVTKLSKYFAMLLFIMMPFVGGWVGYWYAFERHIFTGSLTTSNLQESKQTDLQDSTTYDFNHYSYVPEYRRGESLIDIENLLAKAPFTWNEKEYRTKLLQLNENFINLIDDKSNIGCNAKSAQCKKVTVDGFQYRMRVLNLDDSIQKTQIDFHMDAYIDYLKDQGFAFVYEIAKGFQFTEVYQKNVGNSVQLVEIYTVPLNLRFPDDESMPTSDGVEHSIFISSVFYSYPPTEHSALAFDIGHQSGKKLSVTFEASSLSQFESLKYDDISRSIKVGSSTHPIIVLHDINQDLSFEQQVLDLYFVKKSISVPNGCRIISKENDEAINANNSWRDYYLSRDCGSGPVFLRLFDDLLVAVLYAPQEISSDYIAVNEESILLVNLSD